MTFEEYVDQVKKDELRIHNETGLYIGKTGRLKNEIKTSSFRYSFIPESYNDKSIYQK